MKIRLFSQDKDWNVLENHDLVRDYKIGLGTYEWKISLPLLVIVIICQPSLEIDFILSL